MSWKASGWAKEVKTGSPALKALLMILADYADPETNACFPSQSILAEHSEQSTKTVGRQLKKLEGLGLIKRLRRTNKDGHRTSDLFILQVGVPNGQSVPLAPNGQNVPSLTDTVVSEEPLRTTTGGGEDGDLEEESEDDQDADYWTHTILKDTGLIVSSSQRFKITERLLQIPMHRRYKVACEVSAESPPEHCIKPFGLIMYRINQADRKVA